jgi:transcriptional regulator with XRE-family HTH domain
MKEQSLAKQLGNLIRRLRNERGFSQEVFADRCGVHRTYMGCIERGEKNITLETSNKIAKALGLSLSDLFQKLEQKKTR